MSVADPKLRVLIVDDSAVVRQVLTRGLSTDPGLEVIGTASDPFSARDKILRDKPDVITLDLEMPKMDGLTFLKRLMEYYPIPVVILSSLAERGTDIALQALECGAVDVFPKPRCETKQDLSEHMAQLAQTIKAAACARLPNAKRVLDRPSARLVTQGFRRARPGHGIIAFGASTGGTEALKSVFRELPSDMPGIVAVIHMPEGFTARYAQRLNEICAFRVAEATDGARIEPGTALIARGNQHLTVARAGSSYTAQLRAGPPVCHQRPSVEVLFQSVAFAAGSKAMGVIMTGMGADGADGLAAMRKAGAHTIAQDEASCVVFGMPKEAIARGGADRVLPLDEIALECVRWSQHVSPMSSSQLQGITGDASWKH